MNLGDMRGELILLLGNRSDLLNARYNLWINNCQIELASALQFFQSEKKVTTTMVVGQSEYTLPSECIAIYDLTDTTAMSKIKRTHYRKTDNTNLTQTGTATHYIRFGNYIQIFPIPDAANTMQLRYCVSMTAMSGDADIPTLPQPWHEVIMLGAEWRGWRALGEYQRAALAKNEYIAMVRSKQSEYEIEDSDEEFGVEPII